MRDSTENPGGKTGEFEDFFLKKIELKWKEIDRKMRTLVCKYYHLHFVKSS